MRILFYGADGPQVQLLQLALQRAGYTPGALDGRFGGATLRALRAFQSGAGLVPDGVAGRATHAALRPWYTGYRRHVLRPGDNFYRLAAAYGVSTAAVAIANPGLDPLRLPVGTAVTVPLPFAVTPTDIDWCSELLRFCCEGLAARYPFLTHGSIGSSVLGRPLHRLTLGSGPRQVLFNAVHHANEWITAPLLMKYTETLARAFAYGQEIFDIPARDLLRESTLTVLPCVNPDGMDLVTGDLRDGAPYDAAAAIAADYPDIPFPAGWKANLRGTDPNLQYPAGWEQARELKFAQGYISPAPRDYVGAAPLEAPESRAAYDYTRLWEPALTLSYHSQGRVIYWKYLDLEPPGASALARQFARVSGYAVESTPYASGFAGYKDWFIQEYDRPGYTVEVGLGENPLPISDFDRIYAENSGILTLALRGG